MQSHTFGYFGAYVKLLWITASFDTFLKALDVRTEIARYRNSNALPISIRTEVLGQFCYSQYRLH